MQAISCPMWSENLSKGGEKSQSIQIQTAAATVRDTYQGESKRVHISDGFGYLC